MAPKKTKGKQPTKTVQPKVKANKTSSSSNSASTKSLLAKLAKEILTVDVSDDEGACTKVSHNFANMIIETQGPNPHSREIIQAEVSFHIFSKKKLDGN
jgi:hypothetical protein